MLRLKIVIYLLMIVYCKQCFAGINPYLESRQTVQLSDWLFVKGDRYNAQKNVLDDSSWQPVTIPHTYSHDAITEHGYYQGLTWYRTSLSTNTFKKGERIFIHFAGVGQDADVYLNEKFIGKHSGGYSAFTFELTEHWLWQGKNKLAVKVNNQTSFMTVPVSNFLFNNYGGIYRPVTLFSTPKANITPLYFASAGVFVETKKITSKQAVIEVRTHIDNKSNSEQQLINYTVTDKLGHTLLSKQQRVNVAEQQVITTQLTIDQPVLWDGQKNPHLYQIIVTLNKNTSEQDTVKQKFGLRDIVFDAQKGLLLNGQNLQVKGVSRHQEWQDEATALTDLHHKKDIDLIEEMGANAVRLAHYQQADYMYQLADERGLLVWAEIPFVHTWSGRESGNAKNQLRELILQNFNHPSIITWGIWNEVRAFTPQAPAVKLAEELNTLAHNIDKTRPTTSASDRKDKFTPMEFITDLQGWNLYYGWYDSQPYGFIGDFLDKTHAQKPNVKISVSEYGYGGNVDHQSLNESEKPFGHYFPEHDQALGHEEAWQAIKTRDYVWGTFLWNMFDFSVNSWVRGAKDHINHKGLVTFDRKTKKDAFYFYKSAWSKHPTVYITQHRNNIHQEQYVDIKIYSNLPEITLFINGTKITSKKRAADTNIVRFKQVKLQPGSNHIKVISEYNRQTYSHETTWSYEL